MSIERSKKTCHNCKFCGIAHFGGHNRYPCNKNLRKPLLSDQVDDATECKSFESRVDKK